LGKQNSIADWDIEKLFNKFDVKGNSEVSMEELREGMMNGFHIHLTTDQMKGIADRCVNGTGDISCATLDRGTFEKVVLEILKNKN
jgi:Ca2+-binding EF-hand superfamily protein